MLYLTGQHTVVYEFDTEEEMAQWDQDMNGLKAAIANINTDPVDQQMAVCPSWLQAVERFRATFGADKVPQDIVQAEEEVRNGIQSQN